jgi:hypothetical protein
MNVNLSLNPDVEKGLLARAHERGVSLEDYLQELVAREAAVASSIQSAAPASRRHIAEVIRERMSRVPAEIMATMPKDGASQHDHYIYGVPKRDE